MGHVSVPSNHPTLRVSVVVAHHPALVVPGELVIGLVVLIGGVLWRVGDVVVVIVVIVVRVAMVVEMVLVVELGGGQES